MLVTRTYLSRGALRRPPVDVLLRKLCSRTLRMSKRAAAGDVAPVYKYAFIQCLMANRYMLEQDALEILGEMVGSVNEQQFHQLLADINGELQFAGFQLRILKYPVDGLRYIGFINKEGDEVSKVATSFTHAQREFFKHGLELIATSGSEHGISEVELLNMNTQSTQPASGSEPAAKLTLTKQDRARCLRSLVADGWLANPAARNNYYCVGARSFLELSHYLLSLELPAQTRDLWQQVL